MEPFGTYEKPFNEEERDVVRKIILIFNVL